MKSVLVVCGTRPEVIKLWPVIESLEADDELRASVLCTGQHDELVVGLLESLRIEPDANLEVMSEDQGLEDVTATMLRGIGDYLETGTYDCVIVQGDTTTALAGALAGFYAGVPVAHVEAGLRSGDKRSPFPEEMLRILVDQISDYLFAPTRRARNNLEGARPDEGIWITGNTVVDAVRKAQSSGLMQTTAAVESCEERYDRWLLVTLHRRESFGQRARDILTEMRDFMSGRPELGMLFPVHPNPNIRRPVRALLGGSENVHLTEPLEYFEFLGALAACDAVLTDSGGIQEEASVFEKKVYVVRDVTERTEAIEAGVAELVGTSPGSVEAALARTVDEAGREPVLGLAGDDTPFGDGRAAERIGDVLASRMSARDRETEDWGGFGSS